jgi:hypothetical protein
VAAAACRDEAQARQDYRDWAKDQHSLRAGGHGEFGQDPLQYADAIARADPAAGH